MLIGGVSAGCFFSMVVAVQTILPAHRRAGALTALMVFANSAFHFIVMGSGSALVVCVPSIGGATSLSRSRPQVPQHHLYWMCTAVPLVWALSRAVQHSAATQRIIGALLVTLLAAGAVATFADDFAVWLCATLVSMAAFIVFAVYLIHLVRIGVAMRVAQPLALLAWSLFPVLWLLGQFEVVTPAQEWLLWPMLDFVTKVSFVLMLFQGTFRQHAADSGEELALREVRLQLLTSSSKNAATRNYKLLR